MIRLDLLGTPLLRGPHGPIDLPRRKTRALLFLLAARREPLPRERALALLWPDLERTTARQTLRTTLHGLRTALGAALIAEDHLLRLDTQLVDVDACALDAALAAGAPTALAVAALARWRGEFLEGFAVPDADEYNTWVEGERARLRTLALRGWARLAQDSEEHGAFVSALEYLERALLVAPLHEDLHRDVLRLTYLAGDRPGAIRRFEHLRQRLDDELGVPPMAATRALYDAIITGALARPARPDPPPIRAPLAVVVTPARLPFIGRAAPLAAVRAALAAGRAALVLGEPGIGKTRLVEELLYANGAALSGAGRELEQVLPYQPVIEALRQLLQLPGGGAIYAQLDPVWRTELARLLPELGSPATPAGAPDEARLWEAVTQLLLVLAARQPLTLFIDDLHWADQATLGLFGYLARRTSGSALRLVAAARDLAPRSPAAALVQTLQRADQLTRIVLDRLPASLLADLAAQLDPAPGPVLRDWLVVGAEGNPYLFAELLRYAHEHAQPDAAGQLAFATVESFAPIPPGIYALVSGRLARLSDPARRLLDAAVAVGREFHFAIAAAAAWLDEAAALDALDEVRAAGLVHALDTERFAFDHTLTMEVAYREVGEPRHRQLHRRVAEALLRRADDDTGAGLVATHLAEGGELALAAPYAVRAARRAAMLGAWQAAIGFWQLALRGTTGDDQVALLLELGDAQVLGGDPAHAAETFAAVRARTAGAAHDDATLRLAQALIARAQFAEIIALVAPLATAADPVVRLRAAFIHGTALSIEGSDLSGAQAQLDTAAAICIRDSDGIWRARILFELGGVAAQRGDLDLAVARYRESLAVAREIADDGGFSAVLAYNNLAYHVHLLGDPAAASFAEAGLALAQARGLLAMQSYLFSTLGEIALAAGNLAQAEARFTEGLALAEQLALPERQAGLTANLGLVAAQHGDLALAIHRLSDALARADALGTLHLAAQIRIWLAPLLPAAAPRLLAEARTIAETGGRQRLLAAIDALM